LIQFRSDLAMRRTLRSRLIVPGATGRRRRRSVIQHVVNSALILGVTAVPLVEGGQDRIGHLAPRILAAHNRERDALRLVALKWDHDLAQDAQLWAEHLATLGYLVHSPSEAGDPDPQGENLWAGTKGHYNLSSMVARWAVEKRNYKHGIFPNVSKSGHLEDVGHYTQIVWGSTRLVGCALASGQEYEFLVCRYAEGGNIIGERVY
jgi:hypothetical protein